MDVQNTMRRDVQKCVPNNATVSDRDKPGRFYRPDPAHDLRRIHVAWLDAFETETIGFLEYRRRRQCLFAADGSAGPGYYKPNFV